jgi:hypothetical protein
MFSNSKGLRAYIRQEKIRALMVKLSCRVHWVYLLPVMKKWIREKEVLIRWREVNHSEKIEKKSKKLKERLLDTECNKIKCGCAIGGDLPEEVMGMMERAAEELLLKIEEEEGDGLLNSKETTDPLVHDRTATRQVRLRGKGVPFGKKQGRGDLSHEDTAITPSASYSLYKES